MEAGENTFRLVILSMLLLVGLTRDYSRIRDWLRSTSRRSFGDAVTEFLSSAVESESIVYSGPTALTGLFFFGGLAAYLVNPGLMGWSAMRIPNGLRWAGAILGWAAALGLMWAFLNLGKQYSGLVRIRRDHLLIATGPYVSIRHPIYSFGLPFVAGMALVAANWFLLVFGVVAIGTAMLVRVPNEEAVLVKRFGDSYRQYMERTGRFLPRG